MPVVVLDPWRTIVEVHWGDPNTTIVDINVAVNSSSGPAEDGGLASPPPDGAASISSIRGELQLKESENNVTIDGEVPGLHTQIRFSRRHYWLIGASRVDITPNFPGVTESFQGWEMSINTRVAPRFDDEGNPAFDLARDLAGRLHADNDGTLSTLTFSAPAPDEAHHRDGITDRGTGLTITIFPLGPIGL